MWTVTTGANALTPNMAISFTSGYTFSSGEVLTPAKLNTLGVPVLAAGANTLVGATATGPVTEITCTAAGRALLDDADASAQRTTLGLGTAALSASGAFEASGSIATHAALTTGIHGLGTMSQQAATAVAITGGNAKLAYYAATPSTLTYGATSTIDFSTATATMQTLSLTGNVTLATSNLVAGSAKMVRVICDGSARTYTLPAWKFLNGSAPVSIAASKVGEFVLTSWGTADADVIAYYGVEV